MPKTPVKKSTTKNRAKPQILLLHGYRGNHLGLAKIADSLRADGYEVFVPDILPALPDDVPVGKKLPKDFFTKESYANWIADYIKQKKLKKPLIIGHSMGSILAANLANTYPELIHDKIVFMSPICVNPPKFITRLAPLSVLIPNRPTAYITTKYLIVDKPQFKEILKLTTRCATHNTCARDTARAAKFSSTYAISDFNIKKTAHFIAGESDKLNPQEAVRTLAKKMNAKVVFLPNSGHLINYECPDAVVKEIKKFIKE